MSDEGTGHLEFEPERVFRALNDHGVQYVVIGGYAAVIHGAPTVTSDADICAATDRENLDRLAAALRDTHARIRTDAVPEGLPVTLDGELLSRMAMVNLVTDGGAFDLSFTPSAFPGGFATLAADAVSYDLGGVIVPVASLDDIITSKRAADRPKDRAVLPILEALRDEIERQGGA